MRAAERTLTSEEADASRAAAVEELVGRLGAEIR